MDSTPHSFITPKACFTAACMAFSVLAFSAAWRNNQESPKTTTTKTTTMTTVSSERPLEPGRRSSQAARSRSARRRTVDSLYIETGQYFGFDEADINVGNSSTVERLASLVNLCASLAQRLRSRTTHADIITTSSLLGELSHITTSLCRLQQQLISKPDFHLKGDNHGAFAACFDTTLVGLWESLLLLQEVLAATNEAENANTADVHASLQQLRDQRPALEFLLGNTSTDAARRPPTPPSDSEIEEELKALRSRESIVWSSASASTRSRSAVDAKGWSEPPPEYSPPSSSSSSPIIHSEKADMKSELPVPLPQPGTAQIGPETATLGSAEGEDDGDALYHAVVSNDAGLVASLLQHGADPNKSVGSLQRTPLHQAAHLNHTRPLALLLHTSSAIVSTEDSAGDTALHLAAWAGHVESLSILLASSAVDVDALSGRDGYSALWCAISAHHIDAARLLLKHEAQVSLRSVGGIGMLPLHQAAVTAQAAMCELLLERGALVDARDEESGTALHYAAAAGSSPCVTVLLRAGADVGTKQAQGLTPAHWAAHKGHTDVLILLLGHKDASVKAMANEGATPLHLAANRGHLAVVRLLLEKGARRSRRAMWDGIEGTAAEMARAKGHARVAKTIEGWRRMHIGLSKLGM